MIVTPAGHEGYFDALVALLRATDGPPDPTALAALDEVHGTTVLGG